ncbi:MAG TPA: hypothetical protein VGJ71_08350, partial [Candidatus Limnocylindrales bacterium]
GTETVAVTEAAGNWDPAAEVDRATAILLGVGQGIGSFLILFAIVWLPILVGIGVILVIGYAIARRLGLRRGGIPPIDPLGPIAPPAPSPEG